MFLDKHNRFVRRYNFTFGARHALGATLPLIAAAGQPSVWDALNSMANTDSLKATQPNGDIVTVVEIDPRADGVLVLLFHRDSPNAADPTYRRIKEGKRFIRTGEKDEDEEQTVSAHLVIAPVPGSSGTYKAVLEEIPGLSASSLIEIVRIGLSEYEYDYTDKRGDVKQTYCTLKYEGEKSAKLEEALAKGILNIRLSRPATVDFLDAEGVVSPGRQTATLKLTAELEPKDILEKLKQWKKKASDAGWTDFSVDLQLDNNRQKTVKIEREDEAKEILFVRSEQLDFATSMPVCSPSIVKEFVDKSIELLKP
ncbi:hypothetical protein DXM29_16500 [Agrobacterium tumefaciens]|nr:hypothetical protein DXM29_16500 [Agrobacterium tumefaciens]